MLAGAPRAAGSEPRADLIGQTVEQLNSDIDNLRGIIADLRPADIDELGAEAAIKALAERFEGNGLAVDVSFKLADERRGAGGRHPPELETAVYRVIQEALTNATKHGLAQRAFIEVLEHDDTIHVTVRDDGRGFDPTVGANGFGLPGMLERAELLNGTLIVHSAPGQGARVEATFPSRGRPHDALAVGQGSSPPAA